MVDAAACRAEVAQAASEVGSDRQALMFAGMEANNASNEEDKNKIGNKIEQLKGNLEGSIARNASARADLSAAETAGRKEKLAEELDKQKAEEAALKKETEPAKAEEKELDNKDTKKAVVAKKEPVFIGGELYDIKDGHEDPKVMQEILLAKLKAEVSPEAKDSHVEDTSKDKPSVAANVSAASTPAIATTGTTSVTQDSPTATSRIQGAAGSGSTST